MIWSLSCVVSTRQPKFDLEKPKNLNTSNSDLLETLTRAATFTLVSWNWWGESFYSIWLDSNVLNLNVFFRTDVAQFFQLSIDCIVKAVLEQKNSAHKTISVSLVTCYSLNIGFQTIFFIFSMSCSWAGFPRATGYSPKYMNHLLPLD